MSAAATAAGYLYASGRLRGKSKDNEQEHHHAPAPERKRLRVAALPDQEAPPASPAAERPRRTPRIEYRVRRWRPE
jgi:hypothetical protein